MCAIYDYDAFGQFSARHELLAALPMIKDLSLNFHIFWIPFEINTRAFAWKAFSLRIQTDCGRSKLIDRQYALEYNIHNLRSVKFSKEISCKKWKRVLPFSSGKSYIIADCQSFFVNWNTQISYIIPMKNLKDSFLPLFLRKKTTDIYSIYLIILYLYIIQNRLRISCG